MDDGGGGDHSSVLGGDTPNLLVKYSVGVNASDAGKTFRLRCRVWNAYGASEWSDELTAAASEAPSPPSVSILLSNSTHFTLSLELPSHTGGLEITGLSLFISGFPAISYTPITGYSFPDLAPQFSVSGLSLTAGEYYLVSASVTNANQLQSSRSLPISLTL